MVRNRRIYVNEQPLRKDAIHTQLPCTNHSCGRYLFRCGAKF